MHNIVFALSLERLAEGKKWWRTPSPKLLLCTHSFIPFHFALPYSSLLHFLISLRLSLLLTVSLFQLLPPYPILLLFSFVLSFLASPTPFRRVHCIYIYFDLSIFIYPLSALAFTQLPPFCLNHGLNPPNLRFLYTFPLYTHPFHFDLSSFHSSLYPTPSVLS